MENAANRQRRRIMLAGVGAVAVATAIELGRDGTASYPQGAPLAIGIGALAQGNLLVLEWQGYPVWVLRRSAADIAALAQPSGALLDPDSRQSVQPPMCRNPQRSLQPEIFVAIGLCTHQGCAPALLGADGFLCPCHASRFDLAGRVFKRGPATSNLVIPAYRFETENRLLLGVNA